MILRANDGDLPAVFRVLRKTRNQAADAALAAALPDMENPYRSAALATLVERAAEPALATVIASFTKCDAELQAEIAAHADAFGGAARACMESERIDTRFAAVAFLRASGHGKLAYLLSDALTRPCRKTAEHAGQALGHLIELVAERGVWEATTGERRPPGELEFAAQAVHKALATWPLHFRGEIVAAAASMARPMERDILELVEETRNRTARAFSSLLDASRDPHHIPLAIRMLRATHVREAASKFLAGCAEPAFASALLAESWILGDEALRRACARVRALPAFEQAGAEQFWKTPTRARGLVRWIAAAGVGGGHKRDNLRRMALADEPLTGRAAAWAVIDQGGDWTDEILQMLAGRPGHEFAELARIELQRRGFATRAVQSSVESTAPETGEIPDKSGKTHAERETVFEIYWEQFDTLQMEDRISIGREIARHGDDFQRGLRQKLSAADPVSRGKALAIVRELELEAAFARQIEKAALDPERAVRSAAVMLLGAVDSPTARRLLRNALEDTDERVQANAIEALELHEAASVGAQVAGKLDSPNSRVRANAVKMLLRMRVREGAAHLLGMLQSTRAGDRLSALWVVERMRLGGVVARVEALATTDPDERVRRRAQRVCDTLPKFEHAEAHGGKS